MLRRLLLFAITLVTLCESSLVFAQTCTGLCLQQTSCSGSATTSISGTVYAPNGTDPLPNVLVYVPNAAVLPFTAGVSCQPSGEPATGSPLVSTVTATDGTFTLTDMPSGTNIPLVIQSGRWRRQVTISNVPACVTTTVPASLSRMPKNRSEGDIPKIAVVTGAVDAVECVLRKVGIDDAEFTDASGTGRVNLYLGNGDGGAVVDSSTPVETALENTQAALNAYDMVMFACQGYQYDQATALQQNLIAYANAGGRLFATHYGYVWLYNDPPFSQTANWHVDQNSLPDETGLVNMTFPKGLQLAQWLKHVGASSTLGQLPLSSLRVDQDGVISPTQSWLTASNTVMQFTFNTPVGAAPDQQCGRVLFNEYHVEEVSGYPRIQFPNECAAGTMTPQEKLLEFSLFDLTNAVTSDIPRSATISVSNSPEGFVQGDNSDTVTINVTNTSTTVAINPSLSLTAVLPPGLSSNRMQGSNVSTGWICTAATLTCTRSIGLDAGASDPITLTVMVASDAPISSGATVSATVSGGGLAASVTGQDAIPIKGLPIITWPTPAAVSYGTALSSIQLNATASVPGTYSYSPATGVVLAPGPQTLCVTFTPTDIADYVPVEKCVYLAVSKAAGADVLTTTNATPYFGQSVTLTDTIPVVNGVAPTGTVSFYSGAILLGTAQPNALGIATLTTTALPVGTDSVTAVLAADTNYAQVTSNVQTETVASQDFSIVAAPNSQTIHPGGTTTYTVSLSGITTAFISPVTLTATGLPPGATVSFAKGTYVPGVGPTSTTMTIVTSQAQALRGPSGRGMNIYYGLFLLPLFWIRKARRNIQALLSGIVCCLVALLLVGGLGVTTGCGGGYLGVAPHQYTITVTGASGTLSHSTTVALTIR